MRGAGSQHQISRGRQVDGALAAQSLAHLCRVPRPQKRAQAGRAAGEGGEPPLTPAQSGHTMISCVLFRLRYSFFIQHEILPGIQFSRILNYKICFPD